MLCTKCGREMGAEERECAFCRDASEAVTVLPREERDSFQGVTLDGGTGERTDYHEGAGYREYRSEGPNHRVYVRQMNFGSGGVSLWTKLLLALGIGVLVFVILPIALFAVLGLALLWFIIRMFIR